MWKIKEAKEIQIDFFDNPLALKIRWRGKIPDAKCDFYEEFEVGCEGGTYTAFRKCEDGTVGKLGTHTRDTCPACNGTGRREIKVSINVEIATWGELFANDGIKLKHIKSRLMALLARIQEGEKIKGVRRISDE